jgi:hypothetical protein
VAAKVEAVREQIQNGSFVVPVFDDIPSEEELLEASQPEVDPALE